MERLKVLILAQLLLTLFFTSIDSVSTTNTRYSIQTNRKFQNGCPTAKNGTKMLLNQETGECFPSGRRGPCGENMIFYNHPLYPQSSIGFCDCDQGLKHSSQCSNHPVRRLIYIPRLNKCFHIFSQGPCGKGEWLNLNEGNTQAECQLNPCAETAKQSYTKTNVHKFWFYDPLRKSCFLTQTQGYCPVGLSLEVTHHIHLPRCRRITCIPTFSNIRSPLECKLGSRYSYFLKGCIKSAKYYGAIG